MAEFDTTDPLKSMLAITAFYEELVKQMDQCSVQDFFQTLRNMFLTSWQILGTEISTRLVTNSSMLVTSTIQLVSDIASFNCSGVGQAFGIYMRTITGFVLP